jgi:hypothetical protein
VSSIQCDGGRCYISETGRHFEVCIKERKRNLTQDLLEKSKLAQHAYEEGHKICWSEKKVFQIEPNTIYRKHKESTHVFAKPSDQPTQLGHLSHLDLRYYSKVKKLRLHQV